MIFKKLNGGGEIHSFCPKSVYYKENFYKTNGFIKHLKSISKKQKLFRNGFINVDTSHSSEYHLEKDTIFKDLFENILSESQIYLAELGYNNDFLNKIYVESAWFNISKKGDSIIKHIHPGSFLSGALYVSCDKEDEIVFFGEDDMTIPPQNFNDLSAKFISYKCIPDSILLFKSNINHCTNVQTSNEKITISFNLNYFKK